MEENYGAESVTFNNVGVLTDLITASGRDYADMIYDDMIKIKAENEDLKKTLSEVLNEIKDERPDIVLKNINYIKKEVKDEN